MRLAGFTGLIDARDAALIGTYKAMPIHFPGAVLADLAYGDRGRGGLDQ